MLGLLMSKMTCDLPLIVCDRTPVSSESGLITLTSKFDMGSSIVMNSSGMIYLSFMIHCGLSKEGHVSVIKLDEKITF